MGQKLKDVKSILLIGSGPIVIGQACEFDYSGTQALKVLREEGFRVILVNSNPATIMTDPELADVTYVEPLTVASLEKIIAAERPDALLPTMGGQTALNLAVQLAESGILETYGVRLLGASLEAIKKAEDRDLFKKTMESIGVESAKSRMVSNLDEGKAALAEIGLPVILRPSFTLGGEGGGLATNENDYLALLEKGLFLSPVNTVLVEESLVGWKEYELEVVRDRNDNVIIVCSIENVDPMGVHTGDSITVAPTQTLTDREYQRLRDQAKKIIRAIGVDTGGSNIQFAINPKDGRTVVIEMNPRVSRSSALASKATGFPIAKIAAKLAVGYRLDDLKNDITGTTPASFEPTLDYVVTKIPRFDFQKFTATPPELGTQMKSVGESMAIGRTFKESFMKALSGMENGRVDLSNTEYDRDHTLPNQKLEEQLQLALWTRPFYIFSALRRGLSVERIHKLTGYDPWFLRQFHELVEFERYILSKPKTIDKWSNEELLLAKQYGFTDETLAHWVSKSGTTTSALEITQERHRRGIVPSYDQVDTCAAEFEAQTPYLYGTYHAEKTRRPAPLENSVIILGSGPNRIGQGIEFDYCCVHAAQTIRDMGMKSIMVNYNPETVSTDYDTSSRLYFEPLTAERVIDIWRGEKGCLGVIAQFGGQTPLKIVHQLKQAGVPILGTSVNSIDIAEDRKRFDELMESLKTSGLKGLNQPPSRTALNKDEAINCAEEIGYPVMLRPSYVLGGRGMKIVFTKEALERFIDEALEVSENKPVLIDRFLADAVEADVDAICDGETVVIGGVLEHIEEAGIHSGDSACCIPTFTLSASIQTRLREYTRIIAKALNVVGLINIQYAVKGDDIYILEVNPRASRTVPFSAKAHGVPLARLATMVIMGQKLKDLGITSDLDLNMKSFNVKMPVFPFHKFPGVDVILGPEMKSTGESMGRSKTMAAAYAKALLGAGVTIPTTGTAFVSVADEDKGLALIEIAKNLKKLGFELECTRGTQVFLASHGIPCRPVDKVGQGSPQSNCVALLKQNHYRLVINTSKNDKAIVDSYSIRRTALEKKIPYCTLLTTAKAFVQAIESYKNEALPLIPLAKEGILCLKEQTRIHPTAPAFP
jgi:carbamoyl-phosphate synthase large subunit